MNIAFVIEMCQPQEQKILWFDSQWGSGWHINVNRWRKRYLSLFYPWLIVTPSSLIYATSKLLLKSTVMMFSRNLYISKSKEWCGGYRHRGFRLYWSEVLWIGFNCGGKNCAWPSFLIYANFKMCILMCDVWKYINQGRGLVFCVIFKLRRAVSFQIQGEADFCWYDTDRILLKCPCDQKINSYFSLDFKTMLTKH